MRGDRTCIPELGLRSHAFGTFRVVEMVVVRFPSVHADTGSLGEIEFELGDSSRQAFMDLGLIPEERGRCST
jgi:hypothetical protein